MKGTAVPIVILNSQEFPDLESRPAMFRDDRLFDRLTFEHAARVMWEYAQSEEKKKEQLKKKKDHEKSDDKLPLLKIPEGTDDGCSVISEARKLLARPVNKEIKEQMFWLPTAHKEIVRNLPLRTVGLEDCVLTSAIESCHDLSSKIEIKNFFFYNFVVVFFCFLLLVLVLITTNLRRLSGCVRNLLQKASFTMHPKCKCFKLETVCSLEEYQSHFVVI